MLDSSNSCFGLSIKRIKALLVHLRDERVPLLWRHLTQSTQHLVGVWIGSSNRISDLLQALRVLGLLVGLLCLGHNTLQAEELVEQAGQAQHLVCLGVAVLLRRQVFGTQASFLTQCTQAPSQDVIYALVVTSDELILFTLGVDAALLGFLYVRGCTFSNGLGRGWFLSLRFCLDGFRGFNATWGSFFS